MSDKTIPRLMASFHPQREDGKHIVPAGDSIAFDVTEAVLAMPVQEILMLCDDTRATDELAPLCPAYATHDGPYAVCVEFALYAWLEKVCEFYGVSDCEELSDDDIERLREVVELPKAPCPPQPLMRFAFVLHCPRGNNWRSVCSAPDWKTAIAQLASAQVDAVGTDARRWYIEHAISSFNGALEFVEGADLCDLAAAVEARLAEIGADGERVA